jgi:DnaJ-class molecular chaperone
LHCANGVITKLICRSGLKTAKGETMPKRKCEKCKGKGRVEVAWLGMCGYVDVEEECSICHGTGYIFTKPTPAQRRKVAEVIRKGGK